MNYTVIIYIILGMLPSLIWLAYYLREDVHPEPKKSVLKIFFWGFVMVLPAFFIQTGFISLLVDSNINSVMYALIYSFLVVALSEEILKYLVIRGKIINSPDLDEPLDAMLYMVVSALGFAALENILFFPLFRNGVWLPMASVQVIGWTLIIRFISTTLLHALCSAVVGYSLAISFYDVKRKYVVIFSGIFAATFLHGLYDFSMGSLDGYIKYTIPAFIIVILVFVVLAEFKKLKKLKSICKVK